MLRIFKLPALVVVCLLALVLLILPLAGCNIIPTTQTTPPGPLASFTLTVSVVPSGSGTVSPPGGKYDSGLQVTLAATPSTGYEFDYWEGALAGSSSKASITMTSDKTVTAHFKPGGSPTTTTTKPTTTTTTAPVIPDMIGSWRGTMIITSQSNPFQIGTFNMGVTGQSGTGISGTININFNSAQYTSRAFSGQFRSNGNLSITIAIANSSTSWSFDGKVQGDTISGTWFGTFTNMPSGQASGTWQATRP